MARAVSPWLHRVELRDHGPKDSYLRLAVFAVNAFMDESGTCRPSQERIASAACLGVTTIRRKLAEASRLGWIAQFERAKPGQKWKSIEYRACIPDHLDTSKYDPKEDKWRAKHGAVIPDAALCGTLYPQSKRAKAPAAGTGTSGNCRAVAAVTEQEAPAVDDTKHRPLTHEAPAADDEKDRPERPTKFLREVLDEVLLGEGRSPLGSQPANNVHALAKVMTTARTDEPLEARLSKVRTLLANTPEYPIDTLCTMYRLTPAQVSEARRATA